MSNSKKCVVCGETKEATTDNFFRSKHHDPDGLSSTCKVCNIKQCHEREAAIAAESPLYDPNSKRQDGLKKRSKAYYRKLAVDLLLARGLKKCSCCEEIKPVDAFSKKSDTYTGFHAWCKACNGSSKQ
jgi:hypothetical protein